MIALVHVGSHIRRPWTGSLMSNRTLFFTVLELGESKVRMSAGLVSEESPLSGSIDGHLLVFSHGLRGEGDLWDLFYKGTNPIHEVSTLLAESPPNDPTS